MFAKSAIIALLSSVLVAAAPGHSPSYPPFNNGTTPGGPVLSECVTSYSTSTYTIETTIPIIESRTIYVNGTTTINGVATKTSLVTNQAVITTSTPTCYTTSYPITMWLTKVVDTVAPVAYTETCTETSTYTEPYCSTITTSYPTVESCTEYSTSCATATTVIAATTCTPCTA